MITCFELDRLERPPDGSIVSIGVFDGVHRGHQAILTANVARARELGALSAVITFQRHPKHLLLGRAPKTLTTLEHRLELFSRAGIELTLALRFEEELRSLEPQEFVRRFAEEGLGVRGFVLGFDSKFGRDRLGTPEYLSERGYEVQVVDKVVLSGRAVSSTAIREAVELGDLASATRMLGRQVSVFGRVVRGRSLGRRIGFPTANLDLHHELHPPPGVYACRTHLPDRASEAPLAGVANIGFRPTLESIRPAEPQVEVHLLDFEGDLYGKRIELEFVARLRGEQRFDGIDELSRQIALDVAEARRVLSLPDEPPGSPT